MRPDSTTFALATDAAQQHEKGRHLEHVVKLGQGNFFLQAISMTVEVRQRANGYDVSSPDFHHHSSDRSKALFVAQVVALTEAEVSHRPNVVRLPEDCLLGARRQRSDSTSRHQTWTYRQRIKYMSHGSNKRKRTNSR